MRTRRPEPHTLVGAYAMDALDGPARTRFERHLARCPECTQEIAGLQEATTRLAAAAAARPPAALKQRILAETGRMRQLPPIAPGAAAARHAGGRPAGAGRLRPRAWVPRLALTLAGAAAVASTAVWVTANLAPPQARAPRGPSIAAVLTAPDATIIDARVKTGGTAAVVMSHRERMLVFTAAKLRPLRASQCYELWLMGPRQDRPAGLLPMPKHGMTGPVLASGLHSGDRLGLSVEPVSGSRHPTSTMILVLAL